MIKTADTEAAGIGHNNPPDPFKDMVKEIDDLYGEAKQWLDGEDLTTDGQADTIGDMVAMFRTLKATHTKLKDIEKRPHLDANSAIEKVYKPELTKITRAIDNLLPVLTKWNQKKEAEQKAEAERLRILAEEEAAAAQEELQSSTGNLEAREQAETRVEQSDTLTQEAKKAGKEKTQSGGNYGRKIGMKTIWHTTLIDINDAFVELGDDPRVAEVLITIAKEKVRVNKVCEIKGFEIKDERVAI